MQPLTKKAERAGLCPPRASPALEPAQPPRMRLTRFI